METIQTGEFNWLPAALGCSLVAAILAAGWGIFLSRRTRSRDLKRGQITSNAWFHVAWAAVFFISLPAVFYTVENWRGKPASEESDRNLKPGGAVSDRQSHKHSQVKLADIVVLPVFPNTNAGDADLVLHYDCPDPALFKFSTRNFSLPIQFADVSLTTGIETLARLAGIQYALDPNISRIWPGKQEPIITGRWQNITPAELLFSLINRYGLQLVPNPDTGIAQVTVRDPNASRTHLSPEESDKMKELFQKVIGTNAIADVDGPPLLATSPSEIKPVRIVLHSEGMPTDEEIADLCRQCYPHADQPAAPFISLKHTEPNRVEVYLTRDSTAGNLPGRFYRLKQQ